MKRADAEKRIRSLCRVFAAQNGVAMDGTANPSFGAFRTWLQQHHPECLEFKGRGGPDLLIERWWASEFGQGWKY